MQENEKLQNTKTEEKGKKLLSPKLDVFNFSDKAQKGERADGERAGASPAFSFPALFCVRRRYVAKFHRILTKKIRHGAQNTFIFAENIVKYNNEGELYVGGHAFRPDLRRAFLSERFHHQVIILRSFLILWD